MACVLFGVPGVGLFFFVGPQARRWDKMFPGVSAENGLAQTRLENEPTRVGNQPVCIWLLKKNTTRGYPQNQANGITGLHLRFGICFMFPCQGFKVSHHWTYVDYFPGTYLQMFSNAGYT